MIDATTAALYLLGEFLAAMLFCVGVLSIVGKRHARELQSAYDRAEAAEAKCQEYEDLLDSSCLDSYWPTMPDLPDGVDRFAQHPVAGEPPAQGEQADA